MPFATSAGTTAPHCCSELAAAAWRNMLAHVAMPLPTIAMPTLQELARAKDAAVASEDYDEAKRLKASIERLKVRGQQCIVVLVSWGS
jgi:centrosomal protein CEP104